MSRRQLSTTERIAATRGLAALLLIWIQFFRPKATPRMKFSAGLLLSSSSEYSRKHVSFFHSLIVSVASLHKNLDLQPGILEFVRLCIEVLFITGNRAAQGRNSDSESCDFQLFEKAQGEGITVAWSGCRSRLGSLTHDGYFVTEQHNSCK